jgi:hypothetical protein
MVCGICGLDLPIKGIVRSFRSKKEFPVCADCYRWAVFEVKQAEEVKEVKPIKEGKEPPPLSKAIKKKLELKVEKNE